MWSSQFPVALVTSLASVLAVANPVPSACKSSEGITPTRAQQVKSSFTAYKVVPDVVPAINPTVDLEAKYSDGRAVNLGNVFSTAETTMEPTITFTSEKDYDPATTNYTLIIVSDILRFRILRPAFL